MSSLIIRYSLVVEQATGGASGPLAAVAALVGLGLPLTVSNDVLGGAFTLDSDLTVTMAEGPTADTFSVTLINLPSTSIALLRSVYPAGGLRLTLKLGYFDDPSSTGTVIRGRVTAVRTTIGTDGLGRTVIEGQEEAGYLLLSTPPRVCLPGTVARSSVLTQLLAGANVPLAPGSSITGAVRDLTVRTTTTLVALGELAAQANIPLVIGDGVVALGPAVGSRPAPVVLDPETNLVSRADHQEDDPQLPPGTVRTSLEVTVLGHSGLRPGQVVTLTGLDDVPAPPLRASRVTHTFGTATGYTCTLLLVAAPAGGRAAIGGGVQGVVDRWQQAIGRHGEDHPAIDVGEVTDYQPGSAGKHLATLNYGQLPDGAVVAPSVASPVQTDATLHSTPVSSVFAFDQVGLITPVYPGMRAVLAHNRGLVNDAVITGWLWAENPRSAPPRNLAGDYWLALPTELDGNGRPTGKGANDLIDASGRRTIQVRALHVVVGGPVLPPVGSRPTPDPADDTLVIEHHSGTTITIAADGSLTISTGQQKPLTLTNGQVSLKLDGSSVAVS